MVTDGVSVRRIAALPSAGVQGGFSAPRSARPMVPQDPPNAVSMDSLICGMIQLLESQNMALQAIPADFHFVDNHHKMCRVMAEVVRRMRSAPEVDVAELDQAPGFEPNLEPYLEANDDDDDTLQHLEQRMDEMLQRSDTSKSNHKPRSVGREDFFWGFRRGGKGCLDVRLEVRING